MSKTLFLIAFLLLLSGGAYILQKGYSLSPGWEWLEYLWPSITLILFGTALFLFWQEASMVWKLLSGAGVLLSVIWIGALFAFSSLAASGRSKEMEAIQTQSPDLKFWAISEKAEGFDNEGFFHLERVVPTFPILMHKELTVFFHPENISQKEDKLIISGENSTVIYDLKDRTFNREDE